MRTLGTPLVRVLGGGGLGQGAGVTLSFVYINRIPLTATASAAVAWDNRRIIASYSGASYFLFDGTSWLTKTKPVTGTTARAMFVDSRGYIYLAQLNRIYRSTNNGVSFSLVHTYVADSAAYCTAFTEDASGNVYGTAYADVGNVACFFIKSTDSGANFSEIAPAAWSGWRHTHFIYYDPYRDYLLCATGDGAGDSGHIQYSNDGGSTWTTWAASFQSYAMVADADYLYWGTDALIGENIRDIYRSPTIGGTPERVLSLRPGAGPSMLATVARRDENGNIIFNNGYSVVVSGDHGAGWKSFNHYAYNGNLAAVNFQGSVSDYYSGSKPGVVFVGGATFAKPFDFAMQTSSIADISSASYLLLPFT